MITVDKAASEFLLACRADGLKGNSIRWYRYLLKNLNTWFFGKPLENLTVHQLRAYVASLRERPTRYKGATQRPEMAGGLSHESLRNHLRAMRRFFNWCWREYDYLRGIQGS